MEGSFVIARSVGPNIIPASKTFCRVQGSPKIIGMRPRSGEILWMGMVMVGAVKDIIVCLDGHRHEIAKEYQLGVFPAV